jgi:hypothetical protein
MRRIATAMAIAIILALPVAALADTTTGIPATPPSWPAFIRGGLIAAGLWFAANIAGQLWIRYRQRRQGPPKG